jgi:hypothetical protein
MTLQINKFVQLFERRADYRANSKSLSFTHTCPLAAKIGQSNACSGQLFCGSNVETGNELEHTQPIVKRCIKWGKTVLVAPRLLMVWQAFGLNDAASLPLLDADLARQQFFRFKNRRLAQTPDTGQQA